MWTDPDDQICRRLRVACAALGLLIPTLAVAQWDGAASQQLGMGHGFTALSQSTMRNAMNAQKDDAEAEADPGDYAGSGMTRDARLSSLQAEYRRRVESDGQGSADAWAFEMGRRDARKIAVAD